MALLWTPPLMVTCAAFNEGILLSRWDPHPIAKIPSNCQDPIQSKIDSLPLPQLCSNHPPRLRHYTNQTPKLQLAPRPPTHYHHSLRTPNDLQEPNHISVLICLHHSILVLLNSNFVFTSPSQFSPFHFQYIKPFQYSCSLILAPALPSYISASLLLSSSNSL